MQTSASDSYTLLIAVYGALLGTIGTILSIVLAIREFRKDKRSVRVECNMSLGPTSTGEVLQFVSINAVNTGHRPVEVTTAGLLLNDGNLMIQPQSIMGALPLPKKLEDGESITIYFDYPEVEKVVKDTKTIITKALVRDAEGNTYSCGLPRVLKDRKLAK
jgi:hypothetical protein